MKRKMVVLGAGVSGLAVTYFLKKHYPNAEITLLEKSNRVGGWVRTVQKEGFLFELGPRGFRPKGAGLETLRLIEELGLQNEVIAADPAAHVRFLYRGQRLQQIPTDLWGFLISPLTRQLIFTLCREWFVKPMKEDDPSIYAFIAHRLSPYAAEAFMDPLNSGIYAGDIRQLSMKSCFPSLYEMEKEYGSLMRGMFSKSRPKKCESPFVEAFCKESVVSFKGGMQVLVDALQKRVQEHIVLGQEVQSLKAGEVKTDKAVFRADHIFSTLPAKQLSHLLDIPAIQATSVAVVNLGYRCKLPIPNGFGYLIPSGEKEEILGMVWDSCVFPQQNAHPEETRLTVMIGGAHMIDFQRYTNSDFLEMALKVARKHLGIVCLPDVTHVTLAQDAIPQYSVGHASRLQSIEAALPPEISLLGASYYGVSVNDCVAQALRIVCKKKEGQPESS